MVSTMHQDTQGDLLVIYRKSNGIYLDGRFDDNDSPAWRWIYTPQQARRIAQRLLCLAEVEEVKG